MQMSGFGGLVVSMLASGTQDCRFAPGRRRQIFSGEKFLSMPSFGSEVKPFAPCRRFVACKRSLNGVKITRPFSHTVPPFAIGSAHVDEDMEASGGESGKNLKAGESYGKLPLRTCLECSVPESYWLPYWAVVPAKTGPKG
jgi:hypothetical protein